VKMHCSNLAADALHAAIEDYLKKEGRGEWFDGAKKGDREKEWGKKGWASAADRLTLHITTVLTCVYLCQGTGSIGSIDPTADFSTVF
jgi:hypothetical protein